MPGSRRHKSDHKHRHSSSSSDESYICSTEHKKQEPPKPESKPEKKELEHLEHKINENTKKDKKMEKKVENQIKTLYQRIKQNEKKDNEFKLKYETIVKRLRKEKCLMVNGSDAYATFYSKCEQTIVPSGSAKFEKHKNVLNIDLSHCKTNIKIERSGVYVINLTAQFNQPAQVALFVNGNPELSTVTSTTSLNTIVINQLLQLKRCDEISFNNYLSSEPITTYVPNIGLIPDSKNLVLTLWRIAPTPDKCCLPPKPNKEAWCYFSPCSDSSSETSSDSTDYTSDSKC